MASKQQSTSFSLVFLAAAAAATLLLSGHTTTARQLEDTTDLCESLDFKDLCRDTLEGTSDPILATEKAIKELITETKKVKVRDVRDNKDPKLSGCIESYVAAINDMKKALKSIKEKDQKGLKDNLTSVIEDYGLCDDLYVDGPQKSPLENGNKDMIKMISNCLSLATLINFEQHASI